MCHNKKNLKLYISNYFLIYNADVEKNNVPFLYRKYLFAQRRLGLRSRTEKYNFPHWLGK